MRTVTGEQANDAVRRVMDLVGSGALGEVRVLLHPYLHWTMASGTTVRGRSQVLAVLAKQLGGLDPPATVELRDGQIYWWVEPTPTNPPNL